MGRKEIRRVLLCGAMGLLYAYPALAREPHPGPWSRPTLNFQGVPGLVDMPGAHQMPDAEGSITVNAFGDAMQRNDLLSNTKQLALPLCCCQNGTRL